MLVSMFVCLLAEICQNYSTDFRKIMLLTGFSETRLSSFESYILAVITLGLWLGLRSGVGRDRPANCSAWMMIISHRHKVRCVGAHPLLAL